MLENLDVEFMRLQVHGADSSLMLLKEDDTKFIALIELLNEFVVTRQRDVGGVYVDKLTAKLFTNDQKTAFAKAEAFDLRLGEQTFRYVNEGKSKVPSQNNILVVYADLRANFQEKTAVE